MAVIEVTERMQSVIFQQAQDTLTAWLVEHVGEYYGCYSSDDSTVYTGSGWELVAQRELSDGGHGIVSVGWYVDIDDDKLATAFALRWE